MNYEEEINVLRKEIRNLYYEQAKDRQRIAELELYLNSKSNDGRRDFDLLSVKLMKEVCNRPKGMDYKDVLNFFHFKTPEGAYRLMKKTAKKFPLDVKYLSSKRKNKTMIIVSKVNNSHE